MLTLLEKNPNCSNPVMGNSDFVLESLKSGGEAFIDELANKQAIKKEKLIATQTKLAESAKALTPYAADGTSLADHNKIIKNKSVTHQKEDSILEKKYVTLLTGLKTPSEKNNNYYTAVQLSRIGSAC
ncbi:MAG: hypothetical protein RLZZ225_486 [Pseudomonadota bacterium]